MLPLRIPAASICIVFWKDDADLSPLGPERRVQLSVREQTVLQARQKLEQMSSSGEAKWRSLDPILTD